MVWGFGVFILLLLLFATGCSVQINYCVDDGFCSTREQFGNFECADCMTQDSDGGSQIIKLDAKTNGIAQSIELPAGATISVEIAEVDDVVSPKRASVYAIFDMKPSEDVTDVPFRFTVEKDWLKRNGISDNIAIYVSDDSITWEEAVVSKVDETDSTIIYEAIIPHFSKVAIANYIPSANEQDCKCLDPRTMTCQPVKTQCDDGQYFDSKRGYCLDKVCAAGKTLNHETGLCMTYEYGCKNQRAWNYDTGASIEDGSCLFEVEPEEVVGCPNPLADNYKHDFTIGYEGVCETSCDEGMVFNAETETCEQIQTFFASYGMSVDLDEITKLFEAKRLLDPNNRAGGFNGGDNGDNNDPNDGNPDDNGGNQGYSSCASGYDGSSYGSDYYNDYYDNCGSDNEYLDEYCEIPYLLGTDYDETVCETGIPGYNDPSVETYACDELTLSPYAEACSSLTTLSGDTDSTYQLWMECPITPSCASTCIPGYTYVESDVPGESPRCVEDSEIPTCVDYGYGQDCGEEYRFCGVEGAFNYEDLVDDGTHPDTGQMTIRDDNLCEFCKLGGPIWDSETGDFIPDWDQRIKDFDLVSFDDFQDKLEEEKGDFLPPVDEDTDVKALQDFLIEKEFLAPTFTSGGRERPSNDGDYGRRTAAALQAYNDNVRMEGGFALEGFSEGEESDSVLNLQKFLNSKTDADGKPYLPTVNPETGYSNLDGEYGPITDAARQRYNEDNDLKAPKNLCAFEGAYTDYFYTPLGPDPVGVFDSSLLPFWKFVNLEDLIPEEIRDQVEEEIPELPQLTDEQIEEAKDFMENNPEHLEKLAERVARETGMSAEDAAEMLKNDPAEVQKWQYKLGFRNPDNLDGVPGEGTAFFAENVDPTDQDMVSLLEQFDGVSERTSNRHPVIDIFTTEAAYRVDRVDEIKPGCPWCANTVMQMENLLNLDEKYGNPWTPSFVDNFEEDGRYTKGVKGIQRNDVVFFKGKRKSSSGKYYDSVIHVEVVKDIKKNSKGEVTSLTTIGGNGPSQKLTERKVSPSKIHGYGRYPTPPVHNGDSPENLVSIQAVEAIMQYDEEAYPRVKDHFLTYAEDGDDPNNFQTMVDFIGTGLLQDPDVRTNRASDSRYAKVPADFEYCAWQAATEVGKEDYTWDKHKYGVIAIGGGGSKPGEKLPFETIPGDTLAAKNNNPGNVKVTQGQIDSESYPGLIGKESQGHGKFETIEDGLRAQHNYLSRMFNDEHTAYNSDMSLKTAFGVYDRSSNRGKNHIKFIEDMKLKDVNGNKITGSTKTANIPDEAIPAIQLASMKAEDKNTHDTFVENKIDPEKIADVVGDGIDYVKPGEERTEEEPPMGNEDVDESAQFVALDVGSIIVPSSWPRDAEFYIPIVKAPGELMYLKGNVVKFSSKLKNPNHFEIFVGPGLENYVPLGSGFYGNDYLHRYGSMRVLTGGACG